MYIDAFAGAGVHISKATGEYVAGSPTNALLVQPPFREYYLIDIDRQKVTRLRDETKDRKDVHLYEGDCNRILLEKVSQMSDGNNTVAGYACSILTDCNWTGR